MSRARVFPRVSRSILTRTGGVTPVISEDGKPFGLINGLSLFDFLAKLIGPNPRSDDYRGFPTIHRQMVNGNRIYTRLLRQLERAFTGTPSASHSARSVRYCG